MNRQAVRTAAITAGIGVVVAAVILALFSDAPGTAIIDFITGIFTSSYYFGSMLNTAVLFMTAGTGAALALKSGNLNLGGEGQIYAGGFTAAVLLVHMSKLPAAVAVSTAMTAAMAVSGVLALLSVFLREVKKANILLTSFLISAAVIPVIDSLIAGRFRDQTGNLLATPPIPEDFRFVQIIPPAPLSVTVCIAPLLCIAVWLFINRTTAGRHLQIWETAPEFARYCGYSEQKTLVSSLAASGALHGLTGFFAVCGTYYTCHTGFYSGLGWNALSCALIAHANPAALIPASLILSWLVTAASRAALIQNFGFDMGSLIQGTVLFCISVNFISRRRHT